ncbi:Cell division protein ZapB [Kluyvera cryocrescens]|uniref:Cell division protein ZapB n=1 Tax=Kluyvera cryocrescens TaxID=580 RepID=A0A485AJX1_KLUCR|nr:Cell division protein ZapB [Kluyvera cryocrescens]
MSLEVFEKLEAKVQQAIDTITLLQMEIEELKEKNSTLEQDVQAAQNNREELERENNQLKEQQNGWAGSSAGAAGPHGRSLIPTLPGPFFTVWGSFPPDFPR